MIPPSIHSQIFQKFILRHQRNIDLFKSVIRQTHIRTQKPTQLKKNTRQGKYVNSLSLDELPTVFQSD